MRKQNGFAVLEPLLVILIISVVSLGVYLVYSNQTTKNSKPTPTLVSITVSPTNSPTQVPTLVPTPTGNLMTMFTPIDLNDPNRHIGGYGYLGVSGGVWYVKNGEDFWGIGQYTNKTSRVDAPSDFVAYFEFPDITSFTDNWDSISIGFDSVNYRYLAIAHLHRGQVGSDLVVTILKRQGNENIFTTIKTYTHADPLFSNLIPSVYYVDGNDLVLNLTDCYFCSPNINQKLTLDLSQL